MKDIDLSLLGRESATGPTARTSKTDVPPPRFHRKTRLALPELILPAPGAVLFLTAADVLMPRTPVRVVPVLTKTDTGVGPAGSVEVPALVARDRHTFGGMTPSDRIGRQLSGIEI